MGANGGSARDPGPKKMVFSKIVPRPLGMLQQVFLDHFEHMVTCFGAWKTPKCLQMAVFGPEISQKRVKNVFSRKGILNHMGCQNKCFRPVLCPSSPVLAYGKFENVPFPLKFRYQQQASKHVTFLFWPLLRPNASDPSVVRPP